MSELGSRLRARWGVLLVAASLTVVAAGSAQGAVEPTPGVAPPTKELSWSARVLAPVAARTRPDPKSKAITIIQPTAPLAHGPTILLVLETRIVGEVEWVRLLLARRPNGVSGWVPSDFLRFRSNAMRIVIDQSERRTYVYRSGKQVLAVRNAVGTSSTPTPNGRFAIAEKVLLPPGGFLGPVVMATSGFSNVLNEYAGGNGRFAMHGTSIPGLIGTRASHGCIRHRNDDILRISRMVAPGTPVIIRT